MSDTARRRLHRHHRSPEGAMSRCDQEIARPGEGCPCAAFGIDRDDLPTSGVYTTTHPGVPRMSARRPRPVHRPRRPDDYPSRQPAPLRLHLP